MISGKMIVNGMKDALAVTFKTWLGENKDAVLQIVSASMTDGANVVKAEKSDGPIPKNFFTPAQIAVRWNFHTGSIRRLLRSGALPTVRIGRRVLVPVAAVEEYEKGATLHRRC